MFEAPSPPLRDDAPITAARHAHPVVRAERSLSQGLHRGRYLMHATDVVSHDRTRFEGFAFEGFAFELDGFEGFELDGLISSSPSASVRSDALAWCSWRTGPPVELDGAISSSAHGRAGSACVPYQFVRHHGLRPGHRSGPWRAIAARTPAGVTTSDTRVRASQRVQTASRVSTADHA